MRCGFAVDIGTTNIEISLWNLDADAILCAKSVHNCLCAYGADVVSRIMYAHYNSVETLQKKLVAQLKAEFAEMLGGVFADSCVKPARAVFAGNTVMLHFLCGLSVAGFEKAPFTPASLFGETVPAGSALASLADEVIIPPCISAFLGADIVCASLAVDFAERAAVSCGEAGNACGDAGSAAVTLPDVGEFAVDVKADAAPYMIIDIGTNTEIMLVSADGRWSACSAAAGPAFEGGGLSVEMKGSALVAELARMLDEGIMDETGYIGVTGYIGETSALSKPCTDDGSGCTETSVREKTGADTKLAPDKSGTDERRTILTQQDVRQLQLAKGATAAAAETLLRSVGLDAAEIKKCFICGNFGNALDIESVKKTGLLPAALAEKAVYSGNAALRGAEQILLSKTAALSRVSEIAAGTAVVQLADSPFFAEKYIQRMNFTTF